MNGKTLRISSPDFTQAIALDNGHVLLVRRDGGPHRYCDSMDDAHTKGEIIGEPQPWAQSNPGKSDDGWDNRVSYRGEVLAGIMARSRKYYGAADAAEAAAAAQRSATAARDHELDEIRLRAVVAEERAAAAAAELAELRAAADAEIARLQAIATKAETAPIG